MQFLFPFSTKIEGTWPYGFVGEAEGSGHAITNCLRDPSLPHSSTHSTVQFILHQTCYIYHLLYEKTYLKSRDEMYDFIYETWFYLQNVVGWGSEKKPETEKFPVWLPSHPAFYNMETDCFLVSENAENKPDLPLVGGGSDLMGKKKKQCRARWGQVGWIYSDEVLKSSFLVQFVIFKYAFTFGRWCHYALAVVTLWRGCVEQTIFLFILARSQTEASARDFDATGSRQGNARERGWNKEHTERSVGEGRLREAVDTGQQKRPVAMR